MSTLAVPQDKFDAYTTFKNTPGQIHGSVGGDTSPLGGGCVARSVDGGQTFAPPACFRDTSPAGGWNDQLGHFYDGSSLAVTQNPGGGFSAYVEFIDVHASREALWRMDDITSNAANAFHADTTALGSMGAQQNDSLGPIETHVRLKAAPTGDLWKMSAVGNNFQGSTITVDSAGTTTRFSTADLKINLRRRNAGFVVVAGDAAIGEAINLGNVGLNGSALTLRTGPEFDFDFGFNEAGQPEMRFVYAAVDTSGSTPLFFLQGGFCTLDANPRCNLPGQWRTKAMPSAVALFPAIKYATTPGGTDIPNWMVTFQGRDQANPTATFAVFSTELRKLSSAFVGLGLTQLTAFQTPCPDLRSSLTIDAGYWGDYDTMTYDPNRAIFIRSFTDSSQGCTSRKTFTSQHVHVSTVDFPTNGGILANAITSDCALLPGDKVSCWGRNLQGEMGDGTNIDRLVPTVVQQLVRSTNSIFTGDFGLNCAVEQGGSIACWGPNGSGQLGDGSFVNRPFPVMVGGVTQAMAGTGGGYHACALSFPSSPNAGSVVQCWGDNSYGQIGNGTVGPPVTSASYVQNIGTATAISAGQSHTCALLLPANSSPNTVTCWGSNRFGQLGDGSSFDESAPRTTVGVSGVLAISSGRLHACALLGDHTVWCWGAGYYGQLGNGTMGSLAPQPIPVQVVGITNAIAIAGTDDHTCALLADSTVKCWGSNFYGGLGDGTQTHRSIPVTVLAPPGLPGPNLSGVVALAAAGHTCALLTDHSVWCWGLGGTNGDGTSLDYAQRYAEPIPVRVR